ncbi:50S ribosomal protein L15 [Candidatus Thorarchaeota archaeon]|nr:MAG: 50S ribosomal protein L15 [Candidatus Thorarchaeota archaeon]
MQRRKTKKINKLRGQRSAGYGFTKGHRAAGQRGGKGMAGSKKHHYIKVMTENPRYFGKWGFKRPQKLLENPSTLNIGEIDEAADRFVERGLATKTGKRYSIDVSKLGIDRILGSGKVTRQLNLTGVKAITARAREKVTGIGGTIDLPEE